MTEGTVDPQEGQDPIEGTAGEGEGATSEPTEGGPKPFFNLNELDEEERERLRPAWHRMHSAYNKRMKEMGDIRSKAEWADKLNTDSSFAFQAAQEFLARNGYTVAKQGASPGGGENPTPAVNVPAELVNNIRANMKPEYQFLAEEIAKSIWTGGQMMLQPLQDKRETEDAAARSEAYEVAAENMADKYPGWEDYESDMEEIYDFIRSDRMNHRRFGSKLELLLKMVNPGMAVAEAQHRAGEAARNKITTGTAGRAAGPDYTEKIRDRKLTEHEAFDLAVKQADAELQKHGIKIDER